MGIDDTGLTVILIVLGIAIVLWQLAILTNWRGYRDGHLSRSMGTSNVVRGFLKLPRMSEAERASMRRFAGPVYAIVATTFLLLGLAMFAVGVLELLL